MRVRIYFNLIFSSIPPGRPAPSKDSASRSRRTMIGNECKSRVESKEKKAKAKAKANRKLEEFF